MIVLEHFVYALIEGRGYRPINSPNVSRVISDESYHYIIHEVEIAARRKEPQVLRIRLPSEDVLALTYVRRTSDENGRAGAWSHTILIPISDLLNSVELTSLQERFITGMAELPDTLKPLKVTHV